MNVLHTTLASQQAFPDGRGPWSYDSPFLSNLAFNVHLWIFFIYFSSFKICTQYGSLTFKEEQNVNLLFHIPDFKI